MKYSGVWRGGTDPYTLWAGLDWDTFVAKWTALSGQNQRLVDFETYVVNGKRQYTGVWRAGSDGHYLWVGVDWTNFQAKWQQLAAQNLRLTTMRTYTSGNQRLYAGVWRAGSDAHYLWAGVEWSNFQAKWQELSAQNLRLVDFDTYVENGKRLYNGVWRAGSDAHYLWVGVDWTSFHAKWQDLAGQHLRLTVFRTYLDGGQQHFAGVWRQGDDAHYLWSGVNWENFQSKWHELAAQNLRLINIDVTTDDTETCSPAVVAPSGYVYYLTGDNIGYSWPVVSDGGTNYARLSALEAPDQLFTLPFRDRNVKLWQGWIYNTGGYHHALDFGIDGNTSFEVVAAAEGNVIYSNWDDWSGNTIVVSHNAGGNADAYRTIYMHCRNGAHHDCDAAWTKTIPTLSGQNLTDYTAHLNASGCVANAAARNLDATSWGGDTPTIDASIVGKPVAAGGHLAWAGDTGPGGKRGTAAGSNIHSHVFFARRDPADNTFYFFDPYGLYNEIQCYPNAFAEPIVQNYAGYPIAWKGGKPQYP